MLRRAPAFSFTCILFELASIAGCSSQTESVNCGGIGAPTELHVDVTPALGASVPNKDIVHTLTVLDPIGFDSQAIDYTAAHTAGDPDPALVFSLPDANNTLTAAKITWEYAPAHVEFEFPVVYATPDGCGYVLPSPLFAYDITTP
jgi:hypothetical protein